MNRSTSSDTFRDTSSTPGSQRLSSEFLTKRSTQLVAGIVVVGWGLYNFGLAALAISQLHSNDFGKFYLSAQQWLQGESLYGPNIATRMQAGERSLDFLNMNPPHFHLIVLPLVWLPLSAAAIVWLLANVAAAGAAGRLIAKELRMEPQPRYAFPVLALILSSAATGATFLTGQYTGLLLLGMTAAWKSLRNGRERSSGMWLGALIGLKPFLVLFVPALLARRQPRAAIWAAATVIASVVAGAGIFGWSSYFAWIQTVRNVEWPWAAMNASLFGFLARTFDSSPYYGPVAIRPGIVTAAWLCGAMVMTVITLSAARRSVDQAFAAVTLGALVISPLGWIYYLWLALPGVLPMWRRRVPRAAAVGLICSSTPLAAVFLGQPNSLATTTIGSSYFWSLCSLWLASVHIAGGNDRPTARADTPTPTHGFKVGPA